jgi:pyruvate/2-oxoglutarate dehydrogenase complex dihydrolipoamide acyltransferase (E2) component
MCIPRVFSNIDEKRVRRIFDELNMGQIERVDVVSKTTEKGEKFNRVFVHFRRWFSNTNADTARERLLNGKEIKIIYDEPWFWKVSAYREPEAKVQPKAPVHKKPTIQFDDEDVVARPAQRPAQAPAQAQRPMVDEFGRDVNLKPNNHHQQRQQKPTHQQYQPNHKQQRQPKAPQKAHREEEEDVTTSMQIKSEYHSEPIPVKKRAIVAKKPLKLLEEGEVEE